MNHEDADSHAGNDPQSAGAELDADDAGWRNEHRRRLKRLRADILPADRQRFDRAIGDRLTSLLKARPAQCVGVYWPLPGEPDLRDWYERTSGSGVSLALPVVVGTRQPLQFRRWQPGQPMSRDSYNIPCPQASEGIVPDAILSPCVGFDANGYRLGNGGGYYDRTLAELPDRPFLIGVAYQGLGLSSIRPQPHDVAMDVIVTEEAVVTSNNQGR